ncbi:MAG: CopG family transcriptional regulator [Armatimonadetes bacterium]|nr:CopG family transcriptional regulator [Armatimonadota bacterium]
MKKTVYLPDDLAERVQAYLKQHPGLTLSELVQQSLKQRLSPADPRAILRLAGLVPRATTQAGDRAEDRHVGRAR